MHKYFISHASEDAREATALCQRLEILGAKCWIAPRDIPAGTSYPEALIDGLDHASGLVLLLSAHSNDSRFVHTEVERAFSKQKRIFLIRLEEVVPCRALEFFLSSIQWVDRWDAGFGERIAQIAQTAMPVRTPPPASAPLAPQGAVAHKPTRSRITVRQGDIASMALAAITIPADESMIGNEGLQGIVHLLAGPKLREFCRQHGGGKTGSAVISPGFALPAKQIIHVITPRWREDGADSRRELAACYESVFNLARLNQVTSLAIPLLGSGTHGFPVEVAARIAVDECLAEIDRSPDLRELILISKTDQTFAAIKTCARDKGIA